MATESTPKIAVVRSATDVFDAAASRVIAQTESALSGHHVGGEGTRSYLTALAQEIRGRIPDPTNGSAEAVEMLSTDELFDPFLDALTDDLLRSATDPQIAFSSIQVLRALTALRAARTSDTAAVAEDLRARLRGPDAFELLIEVAHDLRSPLTSILFLAETLRDGNSGPVTSLQRSQLGLMYSAAFGLASVTSDVMDLARQEKDLVEEEREPYAITEVIDRVHRLVQPIAEEKGLDLRVVLPDPPHAYGHPHALSRVLLNLTSNALKFTDQGFVEIAVKKMPRSRLEFSVQDTGRGIPEARREELFHPFKKRMGQGQGGHFFSGSGVGLSIARRLVQAMGSDLTLDSSDETGTCFKFTVLSAPTR